MDEEIKTWMFDIITAIEEIESFVDGMGKNFNNYKNDIRTKRAVERNLGIIGEAMNRILKSKNSIDIGNSRNIVDLRNRLIHGYDSISDEMIWGIVVKHLPKLKTEINSLMI